MANSRRRGARARAGRGRDAVVRSVFFTLATLWRGPDITDDQTVALEVLVIVGDAVYFTSFTVLLAYWYGQPGPLHARARARARVTVISPRPWADRLTGCDCVPPAHRTLARRGLVDVSSRGLLERRALIVRACLALNGLFYLTLLVFTLLAVNVRPRPADRTLGCRLRPDRRGPARGRHPCVRSRARTSTATRLASAS